MVNTLNRITKEKERFIEIIVDGEITMDEKEDFAQIQETLEPKINLSLILDNDSNVISLHLCNTNIE